MANKLINRRYFLRTMALAAGATTLIAHPVGKAIASNKLLDANKASIIESLPRRETLCFSGIQWNSVLGWNPFSDKNNNWAIESGDKPRCVVFEPPYMYNMLDNTVTPLLADGMYSWDEDRTEITFHIKSAAKWSNGAAVTAADFVYTWATHVKYQTYVADAYQEYIDSIIAIDTNTVSIKAKLNIEDKAVNPLQIIGYLCGQYVIPKFWVQTLESRNGEDSTAIKADPANDFVASGPYTKYSADDQAIVLVRNDDYWGKHASMWGKLPSPKYLMHKISPSSTENILALKSGEVDISQDYISNVQDLWLEENLPISTYKNNAPYMICTNLVTAYFNLNNPQLLNNTIRKAIAIAIDYDSIIVNAMTNQSPTFSQVPRSLMNPTDGEQSLYNKDEVQSLQWTGNDIVAANQLLDDAGIIDTDQDGIRELSGQKLSFNVVCPEGWLDWQAAVEVIAAVGNLIGIELTTLFPSSEEYQTVFTNGNQTEYDIFIVWSAGSGPTNPWGRLRQLMSSEFVGATNNWDGNWGGYTNTRIDEIIALIPNTTDIVTLKSLYTEATEIYLTDIPSFTIMYRPELFHTVNETIWTNFPKESDGLNIPPLNLISGYGVAGLYNLRHTKEEIYLPSVVRP